MNLKKNLPVELNHLFRKMLIENFRTMEFYYSVLKDSIQKHKDEEHAHTARQIDYENSTVDKQLKYQNKRISRLVLGHNGDGVQELRDSRVAIASTPFNALSERLYYYFNKMNKTMEDNYKSLNNKIERIVNVNDYGADPTGEKDSTEAFKKAAKNGNVHIHMTAGTYKVTGIKLPNNTILSGEGKDITIIKFADETPGENIVITNEDMTGNAHNIGIKDFTVDGNKWRQDKKFNAAGGSRSSNVRFAGVKNGFAHNIKSIDALLHGFDITFASDDYFYEGDGVRVNEALES